ncbi:MAG: sigma-70 family RNA polymerase sigma factor [Candidatus Omnitrophica bacterium]|nr:sigma-70 family RNA polymerase sigma factor [Candidatus Omnitrophota bacterium]
MVDTKIRFERLVKKLSPTLKRITYWLGRNCVCLDAEDLYQESLFYLWQDYNDGKLSDKTDSYILQGCYFHMRNYIRLQKVRRDTTSLDELINLEFELRLADILESKGDNHAEYIRKLDNRLIAESIQNNGLTDREKQIARFYAEGLTTREIGSRMHISHVRVVKMTKRIREKCRKYLD